MTQFTDKQVALFLKTAGAIEAHPQSFNMDNWFSFPEEDYEEASPSFIPDLTQECDTAGCIAGWFVSLDRPGEFLEIGSVMSEATTLADLSHGQADMLFTSHTRLPATRISARSRLNSSSERYWRNWWLENNLIHRDEEGYCQPVTAKIAAKALRGLADGTYTLTS